jgi:hypothetical protein
MKLSIKKCQKLASDYYLCFEGKRQLKTYRGCQKFYHHKGRGKNNNQLG